VVVHLSSRVRLCSEVGSGCDSAEGVLVALPWRSWQRYSGCYLSNLFLGLPQLSFQFHHFSLLVRSP